jgi:hypothetical protein
MILLLSPIKCGRGQTAYIQLIERKHGPFFLPAWMTELDEPSTMLNIG